MQRFFDRLKLTPAERRLVVGIAAIAFVVLNYLVVWPRFADFRMITDDISGMERKREIYQREILRRPTYEATLKKLRAEGSILPAGEERIQFRSDMERLARDVGLSVPQWGEVLSERSSGGSTNAFFEAIGLTMNRVSGTEGQLVEFLYRVGASNSTIRVKELTLTPGTFDLRAQGKTNLVATIKLVASVQKAATKPPAEPVAATTATATPSLGAPAATAPSVTRPAAAAPSVKTLRVATNMPVATAARTNTYPIPVRMITRTNANPMSRGPGS